MKKVAHSSQYQKYYTPDFSEEELAKDWTLWPGDKTEISKYQSEYQAFIATQICALRMYGTFLTHLTSLSPRIVNYINRQLKLPSSLGITVSRRKMTYHKHLQRIMKYLGFEKLNKISEDKLTAWISQQAQQGYLPASILEKAPAFLVARRILLPRGAFSRGRYFLVRRAKSYQQLFCEDRTHGATRGILSVQACLATGRCGATETMYSRFGAADLRREVVSASTRLIGG